MDGWCMVRDFFAGEATDLRLEERSHGLWAGLSSDGLQETRMKKGIDKSCVPFKSGMVILGTTKPSEAVCTFFCVQGTYITCRNYAGNLTGCACQCAPANGQDCIVHSGNGTTLQRC
ncbi:hypothetical protein PR202_gb11068 [Eleusine coracana subsp. coracana]|uniref:Uncharacterized protein n=1 Tax=Eleusine coracana subsp. coracana TaxID=191504 RepID=A0AAV5EL53_ELECO|nr:hypothetical protein PR202_gb11068 [Eleusine coracana subsp. coracana]